MALTLYKITATGATVIADSLSPPSGSTVVTDPTTSSLLDTTTYYTALDRGVTDFHPANYPEVIPEQISSDTAANIITATGGNKDATLAGLTGEKITIKGVDYKVALRGHTLMVYRPSTSKIIMMPTVYDTYGVGTSTLVTALTSIASGDIAILASYDATTCDIALRNILVDFGSVNSSTWAASRVSHVFIGQRDSLGGTAYEQTATGAGSSAIITANTSFTSTGIVQNTLVSGNLFNIALYQQKATTPVLPSKIGYDFLTDTLYGASSTNTFTLGYNPNSATATASTFSSPAGLGTNITSTGTSAFHFGAGLPVVANKLYTASLYVKDNTNTAGTFNITFGAADSTSGMLSRLFSIAAGTTNGVITTTSPNCTCSAVSGYAGWYRITCTYVPIIATIATVVSNFTSRSMDFSGFMVEPGPSVSAYETITETNSLRSWVRAVPTSNPSSTISNYTTNSNFALNPPSTFALGYGWTTAVLAPDITKDKIGGSGINICNPRYTTFEELTLPPVYTLNGISVLDSAFGYFGSKSLKVTATAANCYTFLSDSDIVYNVTIQPNKKWIMSTYVYATTATTVDLYIKTSAGIQYGITALSVTAGSWQRVSGVIDLTADSSVTCITRVDTNNSGDVTWFDGIMLEAQVGNLATPSEFHLPPNFRSTYTGELDATKGTSFNSFYTIPTIALLTDATLTKTTGRDAITFTDATGTILKSGGSIAASSVNVNAGTTATITANATNILTTGTTAHAFVTGNAVIYKSTGTAITGLTSGKVYFVINVTATTVKLATTRANATAGTAITISTLPTGTHTLTGINYIITATAHPFNQQNAVRYVVSGSPATAVTNLANGSTYYVIYLEADSFGLATSTANATSTSGNASIGIKMGSPVVGSIQTFNSEAWIASAYSTTSYNALVSGSTYAGARASFKLLNTTSVAMLGLSTAPSTSTSYIDINFAIYINGSSFSVFENGVSQGTFGTCATNDIFTISYQGTGTSVNYYRNGELFFTSIQAAAITVPLYFDCSIKRYGSTFSNVSLGVYSAPTLSKASDVIGRINAGNSTNYITNNAIITTHLDEGSITVVDTLFDQNGLTPGVPASGAGTYGTILSYGPLTLTTIDVVTRRTFLIGYQIINYNTNCGEINADLDVTISGVVTTYNNQTDGYIRPTGGMGYRIDSFTIVQDVPANAVVTLTLKLSLVNGNAVTAEMWTAANNLTFSSVSIISLTGKR